MENNKYQEGKIYKIVCNITNEIYYGSTIETLEERLSIHKTAKRKNCISRNIINRGDYKIELIKDYPCNNVWELEEEEGKYIRNNTCINIKIPHRTQKEYQQDKKQEIKQQRKTFYENNKDRLKNSMKKYREDNREELNKKQKEKILCDCGEMIDRRNLARHKKTLKHLKLTECLIID